MQSIKYVPAVTAEAQVGDMQEDKKHVVLLGDQGQGKSTLIEIATGVTGLSSASFHSATEAATPYTTCCKRLRLTDTPGPATMRDSVNHNECIAQTLNGDPVHMICFVVMAHGRVANTLDNISRYLDRFSDLNDHDVLGVVITHMDTVRWKEEHLLPMLKEELDMHRAIFSYHGKPQEELVSDILKNCPEKALDLTIDNRAFSNLFKLKESKYKVLSTVREQVNRFKEIIAAFHKLTLPEGNRQQCTFEFCQFMTDEISRVRNQVSSKCGFDSQSPEGQGYLANMTNQLQTTLHEIQFDCMSYQVQSKTQRLRKCPYCDSVWSKYQLRSNWSSVQRDSVLSCGHRDGAMDDNPCMAHYGFEFDANNSLLKIVDNTERRDNVIAMKAASGTLTGCGRQLIWESMVPLMPHEIPESSTGRTSRKARSRKGKSRDPEVQESQGQPYSAEEHGLRQRWNQFAAWVGYSNDTDEDEDLNEVCEPEVFDIPSDLLEAKGSLPDDRTKTKQHSGGKVGDSLPQHDSASGQLPHIEKTVKQFSEVLDVENCKLSIYAKGDGGESAPVVEQSYEGEKSQLPVDAKGDMC